MVFSDRVNNLDWRSRKAEFVERVGVDAMDEVLRKIGVLVG